MTPEEIKDAVFKRLEKYAGLSLLERFAMFMGVAQMLELSLKNLLHRRYQFELETMERWTLGRVSTVMREQGVREDFVVLLNSVVGHRNYIAHSLLANEMLLQSLLGGQATRLETRSLDLGIYEAEQLWFLYEWTDEHQAWDLVRPGGDSHA
ncbi:hypothetical protein DT603_12175 [Pseudoxanthomonas gei]|uniref:DUF4145 domain-containing protein n=1 Tax=Pseudoxanthomonas gei TaxID=1383030 RepID=A0ABX0ADD8_9GAMM|nr:hypothetical protein [Pseudoxanthomonas gei]